MKPMVVQTAIFLLSAVLPAIGYGAYERDNLLFKTDFRSPASVVPWTGDKGVFVPSAGISGNGAMRLTGNQLSDWPLDPSKLTGTVIFDGVYQLDNVARLQDKPYLGAKLMLVIELKNGEIRWLEPENLTRTGSSGWQQRELVINIPPANEINRMFIRVGLEQAEGKYFLENVRIFRAKMVPERDENYARRDSSKQWPGGKFRGFMTGYDLSENAFAKLREWNVNLLRYQLSAGMRSKQRPVDISTPEKYLQWLDDEIIELDKVLVLAKKYNIKIVIDLHTGPPGSWRNAVASNIMTDPGQVLVSLAAAWRKLAAHYKGNSQIYGYDVLNEPQTEDYVKSEKKPWWRIVEAVVKEIRAIDPDTPIIVEPDLAAVRELRYIDAKNIIYSVHAYYPIEYTHQIAVKSVLPWNYPGYVQGIKCDRTALRNDLMPIREFQLKYNVPIFVGEFSTSVWAAGGDKYLEDLIDIFEEFDWDWTYHAYREWAGWSLEHEGLADWGVKSSPQNPRLQKVLEVLKKNAK